MKTCALFFTLLLLAACGGGADPVATSTPERLSARAPASTQASDYETVVQQIYVGYFGRPADAGGLVFFENAFKSAGAPTTIGAVGQAYTSNAAVRNLIDTFSFSDESKALYPGDNSAFLDAIYQNLFNRKSDAAGMAFWADLLNRGLITRGNAAISIMAGAQTTDLQSIANKTAVARAFTAAFDTSAKSAFYSGLAANVGVRTMLSTVTSSTNPATLTTIALAAASDLINCPAGQERVNGVCQAKVSASGVPQFVTITGYHTMFALTADGDLWGWGDNGSGQLGDGTKIDTIKAKKLGSGYRDVSASNGGDFFNLAVKTDGSLQAWGTDIFRHGAASVLTPTTIATGTFVSVEASTYSEMALKADGSLWSWGSNDSGLAGVGTNTPVPAPTQIGTGFARYSVNGIHSAAVKTDGTLWVWGDGRCGINGPTTALSTGGYKSLTAPLQSGSGFVDAINFGTFTTTIVALKTDGTLWTWGSGAGGALGNGSVGVVCKPEPTQIGSGFKAIAASGGYAVALKTDGSIWGWGHLSISDSKTGADSLVPKQLGTGFTKVFVNTWRAYAIANDGSLWAWGDNYDFGFANTFTYSAVPVKVN